MKWFRKKSKLIKKMARREDLLRMIKSRELDLGINKNLDELNQLLSDSDKKERKSIHYDDTTKRINAQLNEYRKELAIIESDPEIQKQIVFENLNIL